MKAPSNIAFLKYWGKLPPSGDDLDRNLATNASLSMTLKNAVTETTVDAASSDRDELWINGTQANPNDIAKISKHLDRVHAYFDRPRRACRVVSANNFPAGAGIASSASAFAALTLAAAEHLIGGPGTREWVSSTTADVSALARRGSGSACRSVAGPYMKWDGRHATTIPSPWKLHDTILIVSAAHKGVPSSEGHKTAETSPLFETRLTRLPARLAAMEAALAAQDLGRLGPLLETEALEMHAVARTGVPPANYLLPETLRLVEALQSLSQRNFFFTIDAGPNLHVLSEKPVRADLEKILDRTRVSARIWDDETGAGPSSF